MAMEMILGGSAISADEAKSAGLISKVVEHDDLLEVTLKTASKIASHSKLATRMCKEAVNVAHETHLKDGLRFERTQNNANFATYDRAEGMLAFVEKRRAKWEDR